jgi:hypothetical protein
MESCLRLDFFNDLQEPPDYFFWLKKLHGDESKPNGTRMVPRVILSHSCLADVYSSLFPQIVIRSHSCLVDVYIILYISKYDDDMF